MVAPKNFQSFNNDLLNSLLVSSHQEDADVKGTTEKKFIHLMPDGKLLYRYYLQVAGFVRKSKKRSSLPLYTDTRL